MPFKLNISDKGKAWRMQLEGEALVGKKLGEKVNGSEISTDLEGYELEITGAADLSGFPYKKDLQGQELSEFYLQKVGECITKQKALDLENLSEETNYPRKQR